MWRPAVPQMTEIPAWGGPKDGEMIQVPKMATTLGTDCRVAAGAVDPALGYYELRGGKMCWREVRRR